MSEWISFVKDYAIKNNLPYKTALKDASTAYKNRNIKPVEIVEPVEKVKRKYIKKVKENTRAESTVGRAVPQPQIEEVKQKRTYTKKII